MKKSNAGSKFFFLWAGLKFLTPLDTGEHSHQIRLVYSDVIATIRITS